MGCEIAGHGYRSARHGLVDSAAIVQIIDVAVGASMLQRCVTTGVAEPKSAPLSLTWRLDAHEDTRKMGSS
jgi:hypothetical protein